MKGYLSFEVLNTTKSWALVHQNHLVSLRDDFRSIKSFLWTLRMSFSASKTYVWKEVSDGAKINRTVLRKLLMDWSFSSSLILQHSKALRLHSKFSLYFSKFLTSSSREAARIPRRMYVSVNAYHISFMLNPFSSNCSHNNRYTCVIDV